MHDGRDEDPAEWVTRAQAEAEFDMPPAWFDWYYRNGNIDRLSPPHPLAPAVCRDCFLDHLGTEVQHVLQDVQVQGKAPQVDEGYLYMFHGVKPGWLGVQVLAGSVRKGKTAHDAGLHDLQDVLDCLERDPLQEHEVSPGGMLTRLQNATRRIR